MGLPYFFGQLMEKEGEKKSVDSIVWSSTRIQRGGWGEKDVIESF
jgi:hypothetical protein